ncbi:MAG: hypothetical protein HGA22_01665 [Clostridiales bacterium]|nr:hypothetical protein [Clostridiales bacterium]
MNKKFVSYIMVFILLFTLFPLVVHAQGETGSVISAGADSTFVIKKDGSLWGCGANDFGNIGVGNRETVSVFTKILEDVSSVSASEYHTVALKRDGTLWGFGDGTGNRLPDAKNLLYPEKILEDVKAASAGIYYTAAIKTDGSLWISGDFSIGDGRVMDSHNFLKAMDGVKSVIAGDSNCIIIKEDDSLWIWGSNTTGQIGTGKVGDAVYTATKVMDDVAFAALGTSVMAVKKDSTLWIWGNSQRTYTADGIAEESISTPVKVMDNVLQCSTSSNNPTFFVLKRDGSVWGWGSGHVMTSLFGKSVISQPSKVTDDAIAISSESRHLAVVKKDMTLWLGGQSIGGRLGFGKTEKYEHHPLTGILSGIMDVPAAWALAEVREAEYRKLVPPSMQSDYSKTVTRSEFCTLAMICIEQSKQLKIDEYLDSVSIAIPAVSPFEDISGLSAESRKDILSAYALKVVSGTSATTFDPTKPITREQAAKMLTATAAAMGMKTDALFPAFDDGDLVAEWAKPYIGYVFDTKIMGGVGAGKFDPRGGYQRQQAYMTMLRLYKNII